MISDPNRVEPACAGKMDLFRMSMDTKTNKLLSRPSQSTVLYSIGTYYPDKPSSEYQAKTTTFIEALALMYPCVHCAGDFQKEITKSPPRVESRTAFSMWLCEQHNIVNRKLNKPVFVCTMKNLEERWRKGKPLRWGEGGDEDSAQEALG
ncbi:hypothetical protein PsorP6_010220 [Peronosclerospora sorghi]|uniref:Uncharacterized protein n=1 Tax=Peronosclerospora sorghi TaxID=230839 RepID=A0ACC0VX58_9STRA|nr:hypothetical protein PsorP6_010220 [Peronosclerospora sorghi]